MRIRPSRVRQPFQLLRRSKDCRLTAHIAKSGIASHVGRRGFGEMTRLLERFGLSVKTERRFIESASEGVALTVVADFEGGSVSFSSFGERGVPMEEVVAQTYALFKKWHHSGAACNELLAEHLIIPAALGPGESQILMSGDTANMRAALYAAREFLPITGDIQENLDGTSLITIQGCNYHSSQ